MLAGFACSNNTFGKNAWNSYFLKRNIGKYIIETWIGKINNHVCI